jgi:hypothetical protein
MWIPQPPNQRCNFAAAWTSIAIDVSPLPGLRFNVGVSRRSGNVSSGYVRSVAPRRSQLARDRHRALMLAAHKDPTTIKKDI